MDIARPAKPKTGRAVGIAAAVVIIALAAWGLSRLQPAVPTVELATLLTDSVRQGDVVRDVRGPGNLVPERIRYITPVTNGRVERVVALVGQPLAAGDLILVMSSPDQQAQTARAIQQVRQAELDLATLRNTLETQRFTQEIAVASARTAQATARQAAMEADSLLALRLISTFEATRLRLSADEAETRLRVAQEQLRLTLQTVESQLAVAASNIEQLKGIAEYEEERLRSLTLRAPEAGVLQDLALQPGQWVTSGTPIARVVQPERLKAVLRIAESQAKDVQVGQSATIDTRNGIVQGTVSRKDPSAIGGSVIVDVSLEGALPPGAVPDLSVDGTILIERLSNVLYTGRPITGPTTGPTTVFRLVDGGRFATRTAIRLGRSAVTTVEVLSGLEQGDRIILSDMSLYDAVDRVRIR